jgi:hypothetical protein
MKVIQYVLASFIFWKTCVGVKEDSDYECDRYIMESYDLDGRETQSEAKNIICPGVSANCCDYRAQLQIYKKFVVANEGERIKKFYDEFSKAYELIFESFTEIEDLAKTIRERTEEIPNSNCNKFAKTIEFVKVSRMYPKFKLSVKKAYDFLLKSRQGFYCSLCDAKTHEFFNITTKEMKTSWGFCGKMVEETMNYFNFKYNYFLKFSRLYSEFVAKCDLRGIYRKNKFIKNEMKFYRQDKIVGSLAKCEKGFERPGAMNACASFCKRFNPVKYDEFLEGEIDKLFTYQNTLKHMIIKKKEKYEKDIKAEEDFHKSERKLQEVKEVKQTVRLDEDENQINSFNKAFKTAFVRPITYNFDHDLQIKFHVNFDESLFAGGVERLYDLVDFKTIIKKKGINFYNYGEMASIDKDAAMKVFEKLNPNNAKAENEFNKMLEN